MLNVSMGCVSYADDTGGTFLNRCCSHSGSDSQTQLLTAIFPIWLETSLQGMANGGKKTRQVKTTSGNGQAHSSASSRGQWRTAGKWRKTGC